ncbi:hypothetical protein [Smaragdicoccus niigatensis]|uniref:hypothetical protein n=1 Tax=Smaragdicoccus niigatensis TaxID=359359 RepID=UPI00037033E3|nr:hypothetical protein [Smaragdicoccus niigatensis]
MPTLFLLCFIIGVTALVGTLILGEVGGGSGHVSDGLPFLSLTTLAAAIFGFGAGGGVIALTELPVPVQLGAGVGSAVLLVAILRGLLVPYLTRQQSNSHYGRSAYLGKLARVEIRIPVGGWGEVSVPDPDGSRVRLKAKSPENVELPAHAKVYIADLDTEFVHVVAVPEIE